MVLVKEKTWEEASLSKDLQQILQHADIAKPTSVRAKKQAAPLRFFLGGLCISATLLSIPISAYWIETQSCVSVTDVASGIIKSFVFGSIIAFAGSLRGMHCERTTSGVGDATSSAVVTGIMLIVIADAIFAVIYNALGM